MDISPGGELFVTGDNDGLIKIGDTKDGSVRVSSMILFNFEDIYSVFEISKFYTEGVKWTYCRYYYLSLLSFWSRY